MSDFMNYIVIWRVDGQIDCSWALMNSIHYFNDIGDDAMG